MRNCAATSYKEETTVTFGFDAIYIYIYIYIVDPPSNKSAVLSMQQLLIQSIQVC
jgi:hypothetical protein